MKKAKIMLMVIAVLATVGGALAFKAQKLGTTKYCYTIQELPPASTECVATTVNASMTRLQGNDKVWYAPTQTATPEACTLLQTCELTAKTIIP